MTKVDISYTRCDQCGKQVPRNVDRDGWLTIYGSSRQAHRKLVDAMITGASQPTIDICSWHCMQDYTTVQLLDPAPEPQ